MAKIFISYSRADEQFTERLVGRLRVIYPQHTVFYDQQIPGGHRWWTYILNEIADSDLFIYLMSNDSLESSACRAEFTEAVRLEKFVLPVIIRPRTDINRAGDTAPAIREINWVDLSGGFNDDRNVKKLYASVSNLLLQATNRPRAGQTSATMTYNMDDVQGKIVNIGGVVNINREQVVDTPQQPTPEPPVSDAPVVPPPTADPRDALRHAADRMNAGDYGEAAAVIADGLARNPDGATKRRLERMLATCEKQVAAAKRAAEAHREYETIAYLVNNEATRELGCEEWIEFNERFPAYGDPDGLADLCEGAVDSKKTVVKPQDPTAAALARARAFTGKRNRDWEPYITTFADLKIPDMEFCLVPPGTFTMGSASDDIEGWEPEYPSHSQNLDKSFWIARYPVTNAQWRIAVEAGAVVPPQDTGDALKWFNDRRMANVPVVGVTWFMVKDFTNWLGVRFPTEREWEYAARGPESWRYPWGNDWNAEIPIWYENSGGRPKNVTIRVREGASWVGVTHLSGNVWEWTGSSFQPYPYDSMDGREDPNDRAGVRVVRGGSWRNSIASMCAACRREDYPDLTSDLQGCRVARSVTGGD